MAFKTATKPQAVENSGFKKADAFINLSLPYDKEDGTKSSLKLEAIKLYGDKDLHDQLLEMFRKDPVDAANRIRNKLIIDFREANASSGAKLAL